MHEKIRAVEEEIWQELGIPYRVVNIAAGDLGAPAAKKYDIEYWSPNDQTYRERLAISTSASAARTAPSRFFIPLTALLSLSLAPLSLHSKTTPPKMVN